MGAGKIATLFHRIPEILQCHTLFRLALADCARTWDKEERIGEVFVASFSKASVLDYYSDFINNFSLALDVARQESKRKSALADFLKVKQISSHDRLSFFGLMVKPVQRFPQFILLLQVCIIYYNNISGPCLKKKMIYSYICYVLGFVKAHSTGTP